MELENIPVSATVKRLKLRGRVYFYTKHLKKQHIYNIEYVHINEERWKFLWPLSMLGASNPCILFYVASVPSPDAGNH